MEPGLSRRRAIIELDGPIAAPRAFWRRSRWWPSSSRCYMVVNGRATTPAAASSGATPAAQRHARRPAKQQKAAQAQRKTYTVKPGDTPSAHRREDRRAARAAPGAQPRPRPADAGRRARRSSCASERRRVLAALLAAALLLARRAGARRRRRRPPERRRAPSAIVIEVSTGDVACASAAPTAARPIALDDEADDRAADARARPSSRRRLPRPPTTARCPPSRRSACSRASG